MVSAFAGCGIKSRRPIWMTGADINTNATQTAAR
jgi:hypothetical protein